MWETGLIAVLILLAVPPGALVLYPLALRLLRRKGAASASNANSRGFASGSSNPVSSAELTAAAVPNRTVALVTVCHRLDASLDRKLVEFTELSQLDSVTEQHVGLDGVAPPAMVSAPSIIWTSVGEQQGKNAVLQRIHRRALADVLVFTDVDARVSSSSLKHLLDAFDDPAVGAVTGRRVIQDETRFGQAQAAYTGLDNQIRHLEMDCFGSVTSCEGKLYAIRRSLLTGLPTDVTDDLYTGLGALEAGYRLYFEPEAIAFIGRPARDWRHEMIRRRRVTCRGLSTLWHRRAVLDPRRQGGYALALFINKGLRRFSAPCVLSGGALVLILLVGTVGTAGVDFLPELAIALLIMGAGLATVLRSRLSAFPYLLLGSLGMSLGVVDYLVGRRVSVWTPTKASDDPGTS